MLSLTTPALKTAFRRMIFFKQTQLPVTNWVGLLFLALHLILPQTRVAYGQKKENIDRIIVRADNFILLRSEFEVGVLQASQAQKTTDLSKIRCTVLESLALSKLMLAKADIDSVR
jgi:peptidyl-prolyl cis-trans isomerase SurA